MKLTTPAIPTSVVVRQEGAAAEAVGAVVVAARLACNETPVISFIAA